MALRSNEERHEQPDPGAVHVLELREVEHDGPCNGIARAAVRVHQGGFRRTGQLSANGDDRRRVARSSNFEVGLCLGHDCSLGALDGWRGQATAAARSSWSVTKSDSRVIWK